MDSRETFLDHGRQQGFQESKGNLPFLPLLDNPGNWVFVDVRRDKTIKYVPQKGKMRGIQQQNQVFEVRLLGSNIEGLINDGYYTLSPNALLRYQLNERKNSNGYPFSVGIYYNGKDKEGRHQTELMDRLPENGETQQVEQGGQSEESEGGY